MVVFLALIIDYLGGGQKILGQVVDGSGVVNPRVDRVVFAHIVAFVA